MTNDQEETKASEIFKTLKDLAERGETLHLEQGTPQIPECCRENWDSCRHTVPKPPRVKRNIAV